MTTNGVTWIIMEQLQHVYMSVCESMYIRVFAIVLVSVCVACVHMSVPMCAIYQNEDFFPSTYLFKGFCFHKWVLEFLKILLATTNMIL